MNKKKIHIYLMPGMAASPLIFERISLPKDQFEVHLLEWILPNNYNESIESYAKRMSVFIKHDHCVLLGVSFGGVLVQEIKKYITVSKLIIVSSIKSVSELPKHMLLAKITKAYKLLPTQLASRLDLLEKYAYGDLASKRVELYKKYLSVNDTAYLDWAVKEMLNWQQVLPDDSLIHIHGDKDGVFPIKNISKCIVIKNGTHIAILNKYKWFNENLPRLILED